MLRVFDMHCRYYKMQQQSRQANRDMSSVTAKLTAVQDELHREKSFR
jgi:hypothetical protein